MKIIQMLPTLSYGDAIGNYVIMLKECFINHGYESSIYATRIDSRLSNDVASIIENNIKIDKEDLLIYHLATGDVANKLVEKINCKKVLIFHNITPPHYFRRYSVDLEQASNEGYDDLKYLSDKFDYCIAVSEYNKKVLQRFNYKCKIDVCPILIKFEDYNKQKNMGIIKKYNDGYTNILFTGRIAPNKKFEDLITAFYYYKRYINSKSRLILVGNEKGNENYLNCLKIYIENLNLTDVIFTGHIKFNELLAYYNVASIFLCMSEHEGFCVPLVEAMYFNVPIIARDTSAISSTLSGSGILLNESNPIIYALMIERLLNDNDLKNKVLYNQSIRLKSLSKKVLEKKFMKLIENFIEKK